MPDDTKPKRSSQGRDDLPAWWVYTGLGSKDPTKMDQLPPPPGWRRFDGVPEKNPRVLVEDLELQRRFGDLTQGARYRTSAHVVDMVNAALYLRRPLLVTGRPGSGKSSLAHSIAYELDLGSVLVWPVNSRSTLKEGLYGYDAIGRLQEHNLQPRDGSGESEGHDRAAIDQQPPEIGRYIRLGPLGTALLPTELPRVLLIDEIDKADIDLPNDLLHVFETGTFEIPELARLPTDQRTIRVSPHDGRGPDDRVEVSGGRVTCADFPVVILTSNGEREFPPAFKRRCLRLDIKPPPKELLEKIVTSQLGEKAAKAETLIDDFLQRRERGDLATDQLLNALFLVHQKEPPDEQTRERLINEVLRYLDRED